MPNRNQLKLLAICATLSSCAHHKDVEPNVTGLHTVTIRGGSGTSQQRHAIKQANHFCSERSKHAAFEGGSNSKEGSLEETVAKAGKDMIKSMIGQPVYVRRFRCI